MTQTCFSFSKDGFNSGLCKDLLSSFQQNGEFVDMTLAADGYFVKVHQIVIAMASSYLKVLISSADCRHPILFLNNISYKTLTSILEYIYTGEVVVSDEHISQFLEAGKNLHIKGLLDLNICETENQHSNQQSAVQCLNSLNITQNDDNSRSILLTSTVDGKFTKCSEVNLEDNSNPLEESCCPTANNTDDLATIEPKCHKPLQYTVSNQGSLQIIFNRYLYYLKYNTRKSTRKWRCTDYLTSLKCPAYVTTQNDVVLSRTAVHCHPFHDKKILKKLRLGSVYTTLSKAESNCQVKKDKKPMNMKNEPKKAY